MPHSNRICLITLGCPKATVDSEQLLTTLQQHGYALVDAADEADLVLINTCGFIEAAIDQSLSAIGESMAVTDRVIVTGCLGKRADLIRQTYPDVLGITGPHDTPAVLKLVLHHLPLPQSVKPLEESSTAQDNPSDIGIKLTPAHYAYLKISEGCNHHCTFCIIPDLRGQLVSRPIGDILGEAERLAAAGVKELLIISQDTSAYGVDIRYRTGFWHGRPLKSNLYTLTEALSELGIWVRLHYVYPYPSVDDLLVLMAEGKILPYLDVPLQHASPAVLAAMKRPAAIENTLQRIQKWRQICPELTLRSTFITGFPGESEADFNLLLEFLEEARLNRVGAFAYSAVEGAQANQLDGMLPLAIREQRRDLLLQTQADISAALLADKIDQEMVVLVDEIEEDGTYARSAAEAPEIDGRIIIPDFDNARPGDWLTVRITDADTHDLYAVVCD